MTDIGDSVMSIDRLLCTIDEFGQLCQPDLVAINEVISKGGTIMSTSEKKSSKDMIEPKCTELQRIRRIFNERLLKQKETLAKARDLMERVDNANEFCSKGIDLLASQGIENVSIAISVEAAEAKLHEIVQFLDSAEDFRLSTSLRDLEETPSLLNLENIVVSQVSLLLFLKTSMNS